MTRRVFFSFHYEKDIWRANVVRNCWVPQGREAAGFWDSSLWEESKKAGGDAIRRMIDEGLQNTSVTAVLIGTKTSGRQWVSYEIEESDKKGNGLIGIYIHNIKDENGKIAKRGDNPFDNIYTEKAGKRVSFSELYPTYDWVSDAGYDNFGSWVEKSAGASSKLQITVVRTPVLLSQMPKRGRRSSSTGIVRTPRKTPASNAIYARNGMISRHPFPGATKIRQSKRGRGMII